MQQLSAHPLAGTLPIRFSMQPLIDPSHVTRQSLPRPTRETLFSVQQRLTAILADHVHDLQRGDILDRFFATCIAVAERNLGAIRRLSVPFYNECNAILRNLVETNVDYFWVADIATVDEPRARRLAEDFFYFLKAQFGAEANKLAQLCRGDVFFRDISSPFQDQALIDTCIAQSSGRRFGDTWRSEAHTNPDQLELTWEARSSRAAAFAAKSVKLKFAPYLANLRLLSSYVHTDPAQVALEDSVFRDRYFDRQFNIAIGFVYDMIMYSYGRKGWTRPENLVMLQHEFLWFST